MTDHRDAELHTGAGPTPAEHQFAVRRRGFDRDEVHAYIAQLTAELERLTEDNWELRRRLAAAERSTAATVLVELKEELTRAMARLDDVEPRKDQATYSGRGEGAGTSQSAGIASKSKNGA